MRICPSRLKCNYLKIKKLFCNFSFHLWNLHQILNISKEKMIVIANVFSKLQTFKDIVRRLSRKSRFRTPFNSQHVKESHAFVKFGLEHFYHSFSSIWRELICKISPLLTGEILGVFLNTLTPNDKYHVQDYENLHFLIQIKLSQQRKSFSQFFVPFIEST